MLNVVTQELLSNPAFRLYAICVVILVIKMNVVGTMTAVVRGRLKVTLNPEDSGRRGTALADAEPPEVQRVLRAHRNDLENIPNFFAVGLVYVLANGPLMGAYICFSVFTLARVAHSIAYLKGAQPWRSLTFGLGLLSTLALMVMILIRVL